MARKHEPVKCGAPGPRTRHLISLGSLARARAALVPPMPRTLFPPGQPANAPPLRATPRSRPLSGPLHVHNRRRLRHRAARKAPPMHPGGARPRPRPRGELAHADPLQRARLADHGPEWPRPRRPPKARQAGRQGGTPGAAGASVGAAHRVPFRDRCCLHTAIGQAGRCSRRCAAVVVFAAARPAAAVISPVVTRAAAAVAAPAAAACRRSCCRC